MHNRKLPKKEIIRSKKIIESIFTSPIKSASFSVYPLRVVFYPLDNTDIPASILISVSKRKFKHAVDRNKVKRIIREGYRQHKHKLINTLIKEKKSIAIAFIYLSNSLIETNSLNTRIQTALAKIEETYNPEIKSDNIIHHV